MKLLKSLIETMRQTGEFVGLQRLLSVPANLRLSEIFVELDAIQNVQGHCI